MRKHWFRRENEGVCDGWCMECRTYDKILPTAFLTGVLVFLLYFVTLAPPLDFPSAGYINIKKGATVEEVSALLKSRHIIRSTRVFEVALRLYGTDRHMVAGEYFFSGPQSVLKVAARLASGDYELVPVRVTFPEGVTAKEMSQILSKKIADFDAEEFYRLAKPKEGYLFPDTYFIFPGEEPQVVVETLENNFNKRIEVASSSITKFGKPLSDIIIMASLLEKEAADTESRRIIAGILWNRISIGMRLQVDAVFPYIIGKNSFDLTRADLATTSLYNTYKYKGLPVGPIANPGLDSIIAATTPIKTNYVFYLSDLQSKFHYCVTYSCQLANQKKYLGN